ncbi:MAG: hypothetical protein ACP5QT_01570 [Brevinematia bacterium]
MGLRKKAQKYLEFLISDRLDRLDEIYEGQNLTREELLEIKNLIAKKIFQNERELGKKIDILKKILSMSKELEELKSKAEMIEYLMKKLKESFCVKKALFFSVENGDCVVRKLIGLDESLMDTKIDWSIQETQALAKGETNIFENDFSFHKFVSDIESYLLVPILLNGKLLGGFVIFLMEEMKCFSTKENIQIFEWIAAQFKCPFFLCNN